MRQINLEDYQVTTEDQNGKTKSLPYRMRDSIVHVLFHPDLKLTGVELLKQNEFAGKIIICDTPTLLLEEAEYERLKRAVNIVKGYSRNDVEFVRRVLEAGTVEVEAKNNER